MSSQIKNVTIVGASGSIGPSAISALISKGFSVSVLTRQFSTATFQENVTVHRTDYSTPSLLQALEGQDVVVSLIATMSTREQASIIDAAVAAGVKRFIPSEYGIDTSIPEVATLVPPTQGKQETIKYLRTKESSGLSWTAICVGAFFDWTFQRAGLLGWNLPARKAVIFDGGNDEFEATNLEQIGRTIAAVLMPENLEDTKNKYIYVNSFSVTQNRILGILERLTGDHFSIELAKKAELSKRELEPQNFAGETGENVYASISFAVIVAAIYGHGGFNNFSKTRGLWNKKLGLPEEDLEGSLVQILRESGGH